MGLRFPLFARGKSPQKSPFFFTIITLRVITENEICIIVKQKAMGMNKQYKWAKLLQFYFINYMKQVNEVKGGFVNIFY